jgi:hypothetical protein
MSDNLLYRYLMYERREEWFVEFKMKSCTPVEYFRPIEKSLGLIQ